MVTWKFKINIINFERLYKFGSDVRPITDTFLTFETCSPDRDRCSDGKVCLQNVLWNVLRNVFCFYELITQNIGLSRTAFLVSTAPKQWWDSLINCAGVVRLLLLSTTEDIDHGAQFGPHSRPARCRFAKKLFVKPKQSPEKGFCIFYLLRCAANADGKLQ